MKVKAFPFRLRYRTCVRRVKAVGRAVKRLNPSANLCNILAENTCVTPDKAHLNTGLEVSSFELDRQSATSSWTTSSLICRMFL